MTLVLDSSAIAQAVDRASLAAEIRAALTESGGGTASGATPNTAPVMASRPISPATKDSASRDSATRERAAKESAAKSTADPRRVRMAVSDTVTATLAGPGVVPGLPGYAVTVHAKTPKGRPGIAGVVCLHDIDTGDLRAVLASSWLTAVRMGISAAIGTDVLAPPGDLAVGIVGTGVQGRETVRALAALRRLRAVRVTDANPDAAHDVVRVAEEEFGVLATVEPGVDAVVRKADVLVLATWSRTPLLHLRHVRPGLHATSLEADEPGVMQVSDAVRATGLLVVDDRELARPVVGEADSTLGEVLRGEHAGRTSDDDVTLYAPAGLPSQDAVAACHVYERACAAGLGARVDLR